MRALFLLLITTLMLLAEEKIPLNDDAPIKLVHWQNALKEVQPDSNALATPPIKAVQTTLTFETPFNKTPKIMEVEGQKVIVLKNAQLDSKKTMDFKEASLNALEMFSYQNDIYLLSKKAKAGLEIQASNSKDKRQLRFLFLPKGFHLAPPPGLKEKSQHANLASQDEKEQPQSLSNTLELKPPLDLSHAYKALAVIAALLLILYVIKKKIVPTQRSFSAKDFKLEVSVLGRVDANHKIISIETNKERYLVLLSDKYGLLLDKISPKTSKEELIKEAENNIKNSKLGNLYAGKF
ncbi:hypothetical protein EXS88_01545 [Helicobacter pylori]|uniref:hypothetical protein n=1 Tax=Helicobacter pylori TaxID=210 RepID=UPI0009A44C57|nr:hypothetical protein [Helicobacter pylori]NHB41139.1 hypothetical protein [Helicobacter pylori]NHB49309.1 hypothetical protein [Helicobacter pylori]NHB50756.1 hypothetical protein [Helicobacter pylori]OPG60212.1 hypothetical protein BGL83_03920 [Helicobacter pylori]OPG63086.1 hypothetical protein BGL79_00285 [Helicobacter pylori]